MVLCVILAESAGPPMRPPAGFLPTARLIRQMFRLFRQEQPEAAKELVLWQAITFVKQLPMNATASINESAIIFIFITDGRLPQGPGLAMSDKIYYPREMAAVITMTAAKMANVSVICLFKTLLNLPVCGKKQITTEIFNKRQPLTAPTDISMLLRLSPRKTAEISILPVCFKY